MMFREARRAGLSLGLPHILFVDDEPAVLSALRRTLWSERERWDMSFADSGSRALTVMADRPCALLVCDYRMPGMDGAQLLAEVRERHPETVRVILSGQIDTAALDAVDDVADRLLHKPSTAAQIIMCIDELIGRP